MQKKKVSVTPSSSYFIFYHYKISVCDSRVHFINNYLPINTEVLTQKKQKKELAHRVCWLLDCELLAYLNKPETFQLQEDPPPRQTWSCRPSTGRTPAQRRQSLWLPRWTRSCACRPPGCRSHGTWEVWQRAPSRRRPPGRNRHRGGSPWWWSGFQPPVPIGSPRCLRQPLHCI